MNRSLLQAIACSLVLTLAAVGCGSSSTGEVDPCLTALRINLEVGDGAVINEVEYQITGNNMEMGGTINTSAPGATASVETFGIPEGEGYIVTMIAMSVDRMLMCGGSASFDVAPGLTAEVDVMLNCKGTERFGGVRVNGKLNICAELEKVIVAPLQTADGYALEVEADASDEDDGDDEAIEYRWLAMPGSGSFDDPAAKETIFTCGEAADEELRIEVSDDDFKWCVDYWVIDVSCVPDDGTGGSGGSGGSGGTGGSGGSGGIGGTGGGIGGSGGSGGSGGTGGSDGGVGGSGGGGSGGSVGTGGSGGSVGTGGSGGGDGTGGNDGSGGGGIGGLPPECLVTLSVQ